MMIKKNITLFSGGRGCKNLLGSIIDDVNKEKISLNVIVNGLDDGASTGKIRHLFSEPTHGISDFLKVILSLSKNQEIITVFDKRFPVYDYQNNNKINSNILNFIKNKDELDLLRSHDLDTETISIIRESLKNFIEHITKNDTLFNLSDFKLGNIVFASEIILKNFVFKRAISSFMNLTGVPTKNIKIIESTNEPAYLCGILQQGIFLPNEASVVLLRTSDYVEDIFQIKKPLSGEEIREISSLEKDKKISFLKTISVNNVVSSDVSEAISLSDCIVYGAGTPYSSLLPSLSIKNTSKYISERNCPKILVANLKKETSNSFSVNNLIRDLIKFCTEKSNLKNINPNLLITHLLVSKQIDKKHLSNAINYKIKEIKEEFPWINVIEEDLSSSEDWFKHDGKKLKNAIFNIMTND